MVHSCQTATSRASHHDAEAKIIAQGFNITENNGYNYSWVEDRNCDIFCMYIFGLVSFVQYGSVKNCAPTLYI